MRPSLRARREGGLWAPALKPYPTDALLAAEESSRMNFANAFAVLVVFASIVGAVVLVIVTFVGMQSMKRRVERLEAELRALRARPEALGRDRTDAAPASQPVARQHREPEPWSSAAVMSAAP